MKMHIKCYFAFELSLYIASLYLFSNTIVEAVVEKDDVTSQNGSTPLEEEQSIVCIDQTDLTAKEDTNRDEIQKLLGIDANK